MRHPYVGLIPTSDAQAAAEGIACHARSGPGRLRRPARRAWEAPDAAALDAQTLATWLDAHWSRRRPATSWRWPSRPSSGPGPGELSLLFALFYLHAGGGLTNLARTTGGAQEGRFDGGSQQLAKGMAAELGDRVVLGAPVHAVAYGPDTSP